MSFDANKFEVREWIGLDHAGSLAKFAKTYNSNGLLLTEHKTRAEFEVGRPSLLKEYIYDSAGNLKTVNLSIAEWSATQEAIYTATNPSTFNIVGESPSSPLYVTNSESPGDEVVNRQTSSIASGASADHDYTVSADKTFLGVELYASSSAKIKVEIKKETSASSGSFNTLFEVFNSGSFPNIQIPTHKILKQATGAKIRVTVTNREAAGPYDVYTTLVGLEI